MQKKYETCMKAYKNSSSLRLLIPQLCEEQWWYLKIFAILNNKYIGWNNQTNLSSVTRIKIIYFCERRGGLMVSALDTGSSGLGSGPGQGHCVVFLGKTLYSHGASLHPGV